MQAVAVEKLKLHIVLTNTARDAIKQHVPDEHAFFSLQKAFVVFVEKLEHDGQQLHITLYFDGEKNKGLLSFFVYIVFAEKAGFNDYTSFYRYYKKRYKTPPKEIK